MKEKHLLTRSITEGLLSYGLGRHIEFADTQVVDEICAQAEQEELRTGDLIFMRPNDCHGVSTNSENIFELINIAFPNEVLEKLYKLYKGTKTILITDNVGHSNDIIVSIDEFQIKLTIYNRIEV